jgi:ADP-heptose:LPS heptosyltransferase
LQKEIRLEDRTILAEFSEIHAHDAALHDFSDTAALVSELDLVVTVDTAVAHLAGAMGKDVWIMLPYLSDFRWMTESSDSPWYPTAQLFRQDSRGDWGSVITKLLSKMNGNLALRPASK